MRTHGRHSRRRDGHLGPTEGPAQDAPAPASLPTLIPAAGAAVPGGVAAARRYASASRAASTRDKYERAWDAFQLWCDAEALTALPAHPGTVAVYLARRAEGGLSPAALGLALAAIGWVHRQAGHVAPHRAEGGGVVADVLSGARRSHARPPRRKAAADGAVLAQVLAALTGEDLRAVRDRAVLVFGMACCLRRSELVALDVADLERVPEGLRVTVRRSKTDQEGRGAVVAVPEGRQLRPVAALEAWLRAAGVTEGPVFRRLTRDGTRATAEPMSDRAVARVVQTRVAAAGLDAATFGGHSLRAGFVTAAAAAGASAFRMREVSRHKSIQVLADYVRTARAFEDHPGEAFL